MCVECSSERELYGSARRLQQVIKVMQELRMQTTWQRILRKKRHDAALSQHKEGLKNALTAFTVRCYCFYLFTRCDGGLNCRVIDQWHHCNELPARTGGQQL